MHTRKPGTKYGPPANSSKQRKQHKLSWALHQVTGSKGTLNQANFGLKLPEFAITVYEITARLDKLEKLLRHELANIK